MMGRIYDAMLYRWLLFWLWADEKHEAAETYMRKRLAERS